MAYVYLVLHGRTAREEAQKPLPFGPGMSPQDAACVHALVVYCSSWTDPGGDWVRFLAVDRSGRILADVCTDGY